MDTVNPWLSMWVRPRETIRYIVDSDRTRYVMLLAALGGILQALELAMSRDLGEKTNDFGAILAFGLVGGAIGGIVGVFIVGAILKVTGRWLGGRANAKDVRTAIAWANVPSIWAGIFWLPELLILRRELFMERSPMLEASSSLSVTFTVFQFVQFIVGIWAAIALIKCVAEVHRFSAWKSIAAIAIPALIVIIAVNLVVRVIG